MKDTYNFSEFGYWRRVLCGAALLACLAIGGSALWGAPTPPPDCQLGIQSLTIAQASIIAEATGPSGVATATVTFNCPLSFNYYVPTVYLYNQGVEVGGGQICGGLLGNPVYWNQPVTAPMTLTMKVQLWPLDIWSGSVSVTVLPGGTLASRANLGICSSGSCAGSPINVTDGNVWIPQRDYAVPGLGGGLQLSRIWNSRWLYATPPTLAGMFGSSWRSTYEEMLAGPDSNNKITYWRSDGGGWTFTYNDVLSSYSLTSPPNERAQLVMNSGNGGFTLTLADGTQRLFNNQNLLSAIVDRNNNQTTLAYDSLNRLTSVTSPGGKTLTFTYGDSNNPMQATTAQDSVGTVATYVYDSSSRLTSVTYADGSGMNFNYDPTSSMILSVNDKQGKLLESHTYDALYRGLTSARAYGVDNVSLVY